MTFINPFSVANIVMHPMHGTRFIPLHLPLPASIAIQISFLPLRLLRLMPLLTL
jgi:hypothetical protein